MRPLKLTLTAFGPYKDKEVIDFTELAENQLFVISGQTGSGKTTIFDGICFALYGTASGEDRDDVSLLRSHFADDNIHTAAELVFELNNNTYRILRQIGHIKEGNKTKTGDNYEFFKISDEIETPMVDRQNVTNINQRVEQLIGLTQDQFKQIVMLPQGEFRRLLTSETENKEEILRRLFETESYKQITEQLKIRRDKLQSEFEKIEQLRDYYIQMIHGTLEARPDSQLFHVLNSPHYNVNQVVDGLSEEVIYYKNEVEKNEIRAKTANKAYEKRNMIYFEAKAINELFESLDKKQKELAKLEEQTPQMKEKEQVLVNAERANEVEPIENIFNESAINRKRRNKEVEQALKMASEKKQILKRAHEIFSKEQKNESIRESLRKKESELTQFLPTVENLSNNRHLLKTQAERLEIKQKKIEEVEKKLKENIDKKEQVNADILKYDKITRSYMKKVKRLNDLQIKYDHLDQFVIAKDKYERLKKDVLIKQKKYQTIEQEYRKAEKIWLNDQAVILAINLKENDPCPVCGGTEHPAKAVEHPTGVTKEELDHLKQKFERDNNFYNEARAILKNGESDLEIYREKVMQYKINEHEIKQVIDELDVQKKELNQEVKDIEERQKQVDELREKDSSLQAKITELGANREKKIKEHQNLMKSYTENQAIYKERLKLVPKELQQIDKLNEKIKTIHTELKYLENAWKLAEDNLRRASLDDARITSQLELAQRELTDATKQQENAKLLFMEKINELQFISIEHYKNSKLASDERKKLKEEIEQFNLYLNQLGEETKTLTKRLENENKVNLSELKEEVEQFKVSYEKALNLLNRTKTKVEEARNIYNNIKKEHDNVMGHEIKLRRVIDLYDTIRGHNNKRISFERYLQIGYLEQIIDAANERLKDLSNGQFLLIRSERQETYGRQSGLALDIYDAYTGQARDVKSLSGGEKFNTSLCLALGMSDVIQSFQGGISIETMFIDEGFGSLDEESLNKSIDTLIDLQQSGRMIGVISHVEQLKSIFPAILEVTKRKEGYSKTEFIIK